MNKNAALAVVIAIMVIGGALSHLVGCSGQTPVPQPSPSCIQLPEVSNESVRSAALDAGAKLEKLPIDANLKVNFEDKGKVVFQTVTEKEVAFLLLIRAFECLMKEANTPEKLAILKAVQPEIFATFRALWASSHDLKGASGERLSLQELNLLKKSPYGPPILQELKRYGISE